MVGEYLPRERRLASEYAEQRFGRLGIQYVLGMPLGPIPETAIKTWGPEKARLVYRPWRPEVDIAAFMADKLVIAEAKIFKILDGFSKLLQYRQLVKSTPELKEYHQKPVEARIVIPWIPDWLLERAADENVIIDVYKPAWIDDYVADMHRYWTKEYRISRQPRRVGGV